ncbi:MAG: type VI secretion system tip protein VgrG [Pyrinomonadaceae bacterium]|nr:type VI secretion system tip protein VgrG [Pyrinomonadaceae bacterium]
MATTQQNRLLNIFTPLGADFLLLNRLSATEEISSLFSFEVELLHEENEVGFETTVVDVKAILGQAVAIEIAQRDGTTRTLTGIVNQFSQGHRDTRFSYYYATIVPHVWLLTQNRQSRIFQNKSVPDILRAIFNSQGFEVTYELQGTYKPRNYCVQYRESDFDFVSRLMEEEGIYYFFEHTDGKHKMIIADTPQSHRDCPSKSDIAYFLKVEDVEDFVTSIRKWQTDYKLQTGKVSFWDFNFQLPTNHLDATHPSLFTVGDNQKLEIYDFPAGYARKYDGISRSGGEQAADLQNIFEDKTRKAEIVMQSIDSQYRVISGNSDCSSLTTGYRFTLTNHPNTFQNGQYVIMSATHEAEQNPTYITDDDIEKPYNNSFTCIAHGRGAPPFRPAPRTPKPLVTGSQTAMVVGPAGEEIFTDKYGRVKVQLHWDREGQSNSDSSCWIRVAQAWAGNKWGMMFIPRIGMEVIVHFLEGDPDQPIITGCVYNPETMPPYTLPDEKTKSTIKSDSSKGGGGFNEFRIEDKKGGEQIFIHGEKNLDVRIKNDAMELIQKDRHLIVENDQLEKVSKDKHLQVGGDKNEKVDGSVSLKVGSDIQEKVGQKYGLDAGMEVYIKAGTNVVVESGTTLTLKVGGNFININSGGIFIKGTMVFINSGGAAGSGAAISPDPPKPPKEADHADPGMRTKPPKPQPPPARPQFVSPAAIVMISAAQTGKAFCEICSRESSPDLPMPVKAKVAQPAPAKQPAQTPSPVEVKSEAASPPEVKSEAASPPVALAEKKQEEKKDWIEIILVDMDGKPVPNARYRITPPGGAP